MEPKKTYYTVQELAEKADVSVATVRRWARDGELKPEEDFYKVGREYRFFREKMNSRFHLVDE